MIDKSNYIKDKIETNKKIQKDIEFEMEKALLNKKEIDDSLNFLSSKIQENLVATNALFLFKESNTWQKRNLISKISLSVFSALLSLIFLSIFKIDSAFLISFAIFSISIVFSMILTYLEYGDFSYMCQSIKEAFSDENDNKLNQLETDKIEILGYQSRFICQKERFNNFYNSFDVELNKIKKEISKDQKELTSLV